MVWPLKGISPASAVKPDHRWKSFYIFRMVQIEHTTFIDVFIFQEVLILDNTIIFSVKEAVVKDKKAILDAYPFYG